MSDIRYKSTRGKQTGLKFEEVVLGGLATDGGLFIPETIPQFSLDDIEKLRGLSFIDLAYEIISKFVGPEDIPSSTLKDIIRKSFSVFRSKDITPSIWLSEHWVLELFHGPTFAFKDVALQFLGNVFEFFLKRGKIQNSITILGATSGDTGSAAIHGLRGKENVNCFIMYPLGKVTEIQERQMTTIPDENVHCISIEGDFDDAQAIVKSAFADSRFRDEVHLGAINSINWARVLAQITYYFYSWLRVTDTTSSLAASAPPVINYAVPTGNFGDILAGYYAKRMGLPIGKLVVCTNENDVLHRFLNTGIYKKIPSTLTIAPSMDISISSNFERYLYYLAGESSELLNRWMEIFETTGEVNIPVKLLESARLDFMSVSSTKENIIQTMRETFDKHNYLLCPHTATAVYAVKSLKLDPQTTVCLATAHPAKFEEAVNLALCDGRQVPNRPAELSVLFNLPVRTTALTNSLTRVQSFMREKTSKLKKSSNISSGLIAFSVSAIALATAAFIIWQRSKK